MTEYASLSKYFSKNVQVVIQVVTNKKVMAKTPREANLYGNWCVRKGLSFGDRASPFIFYRFTNSRNTSGFFGHSKYWVVRDHLEFSFRQSSRKHQKVRMLSSDQNCCLLVIPDMLISRVCTRHV